MVHKKRLLSFIFIVVCVSISATSFGQTLPSEEASGGDGSQTTTEIDSSTEVMTTLFEDFSTQFHEDEYRTFKFNGKPHIYFVSDSNIAFRRGTIILLPDTFGKNIHPNYVKPMTNQLTDAGWQVVTSFLPVSIYETEEQIKENSTASASATSDTSESDAANDTPLEQINSEDVTNDEVETLALVNPMSGVSNFAQAQADACAKNSKNFVDTLLSETKNLGARRIVAAKGLSAYCLVKGNFSAANGLVLISPYAPNRALNNELPNLIANSQLPVLDIVSNWDSRWSLATKEQRKISATRQIKTHYRQRTIVGAALSPIQSQYLSKEIYGWLSYLGY